MSCEINGITYLTQADAAAVDVHLTGPSEGFSFDQLMELAGLSVATAICEEFPLRNRILTICGPGNNGGDGLVAARHLQHFGHSVDVWYPKPTPKPFFQKLVVQATSAGVAFLDGPVPSSYDLIVDAIFGFSFQGDIRAPFADVLAALRAPHVLPPIVSIDVPSGWDVEHGNVTGLGITPCMLISLTVPKLCARHFRGLHYIGGRFISKSFAATHRITLPVYPGTQQHVKLH